MTDDEAVDALALPLAFRGDHPGPRVGPCGRRGPAARGTMAADEIMVITLSGRGDKDMHDLARRRGVVV